jgi:UDP-N-acetylmuramoyl-L-alanyl-D-glutamate--2,6-diaminopimelate ligase
MPSGLRRRLPRGQLARAPPGPRPRVPLPGLAAFTNLTRDHIDYHGDLASYLDVKTMLFDGRQRRRPRTCARSTPTTLPGRVLAEACRRRGAVLAFGLRGRAPMSARPTSPSTRAARSSPPSPPRGPFRRLPSSALPGDYNVSNVLCALAMAAALGRDPLALAPALAAFPGVPGRMERVEAGQPYPVFVDYAHTDDALR